MLRESPKDWKLYHLEGNKKLYAWNGAHQCGLYCVPPIHAYLNFCQGPWPGEGWTEQDILEYYEARGKRIVAYQLAMEAPIPDIAGVDTAYLVFLQPLKDSVSPPFTFRSQQSHGR